MQDELITDMRHCLPADLLDTGYRPGTWRLVDYRTAQFSGTMIYSGPGMESGELRLPLRRPGYHAIYVGVNYPWHEDSHISLRLSGDPGFTLVRGEIQSAKDIGGIPESLQSFHTDKAFGAHQATEAFWKVADLTDQDLVIGRSSQGQYASFYSNLSHLRLIPLSADELARWQEEHPRPDTRCLAAMNDGGTFKDIYTREDIHAQLEPYRDTDVGLMLWACFKGENCTYRSQIGRPLPSAYNPFDRFASGDFWDHNLRALEARGVDFMTELTSSAHERGIRIFPSLRLQTPNKPVPRDMAPGAFWAQHPEWHCRNERGDPIGHLSLAFPEARQFWIDLLLEAVAYGFDGAHVIFCRSQPFVYCEDPVVQRFRQEYGEGPGQQPENDPRFQRVMAHFVTEFARQLRGAMDELGQKLGRRLEVAFNVRTSIADNMLWGIDLATLVRERLIDYLMPHPTVAKTAADWLPALAEMVRGTGIRLWPDLYPRRQPPAASLYSARTLYDLGADGIALWDTYNRVHRISEWAMMQRLGHRDELADWCAQERGNDYFRVLDYEWLGDRAGDPRFFQTDG